MSKRGVGLARQRTRMERNFFSHFPSFISSDDVHIKPLTCAFDPPIKCIFSLLSPRVNPTDPPLQFPKSIERILLLPLQAPDQFPRATNASRDPCIKKGPGRQSNDLFVEVGCSCARLKIAAWPCWNGTCVWLVVSHVEGKG